MRNDINLMSFGRVPPQDIEIEKAVIGAIMLERDSFELVMEILPTPECFYSDAHQKIYKSCCILYNTGNVVDLLTVTDQLTKDGSIDTVGGAYALTTLTQAVNSTAHIQDHARIVMEKYMWRELIRISMENITTAYNASEDVFETIENLEHKIRNISDGIVTDDLQPISSIYQELLFDIETQDTNKTDLTGVETGYVELNSVTNGWQSSELIILAARPSQGKTALALNFAVNAKAKTLFFSLEASSKALVKRIAACKNNIPFKAIRSGILNDFQKSILNHAIADFNRLPLKIDDKTQTLSGIMKSCRREKKRNPDLGLIIIDYLQLIKTTKEKNGNREQEVGNISRSLKLLASELEVPIIALAQLNRAVEQTANKKPSLSNLRESGSLEQDANIVIFIWHEETGKNSDNTPIVKTQLLIEKNRDGECKPIELKFNGDIQRWINAEDFDQAKTASFITNQYQRTPYKNDIDEDTPF